MTTPFPFVSGAVLTAAQLNDIQNLPISDKTVDYVLVVGDVTKRTIMDAAGATTITVDDSIFTVGDVIQVANKGAGVCTITAGVGVTVNTSGSLALGAFGGGYLLCLSASTFTFFNLGGGGVSYGVATGGTSSSITVDGINYTLLTFLSDDNLVVTSDGLFDVLLVGGGSGGARDDTGFAGGGGGGGGILLETVNLSSASYTVTVGAGGAGTSTNNSNGFNGTMSIIGDFAAGFGGAGDSSSNFTGGINRAMATSGGGRGRSGFTASQNVLMGGQGAKGGAGVNTSGGGGGGQVVGGAASGGTGGAGGAGLTTGFNGTSLVLGSGGGGGGASTGGSGGTNAGDGGGGGAGTAASPANRGGGGGGSANTGNSGAGTSGIVLVRFEV